MKILFFINSLKHKSGTERVACNLANLFSDDLNFEVAIINRDTEFNDAAYHISDNVNVVKAAGNFFDFYNQSQSYIKSFKPDILVFHNMGKLSLLLSLLRKNGAKSVSLEHVAFDIRPHWVKVFSKILYRNIDGVVVLTDHDKESYHFFKKKLTKICNISPYSIDQNLVYNPNCFDIISIGRLTYQKNFSSLLDAWKLISDNNPKWKLKIYGTGEDQSLLTNKIIDEKLSNVSLLGAVSNVDQIYKKSAFFVMSSRFEGLPMVLIEAQTFGLPIISYDCPHGPAEVIKHGLNGLLVENQNYELLANAIQELINNECKRISLSSQAIQDAERYSVESVLSVWKNFLASL